MTAIALADQILQRIGRSGISATLSTVSVEHRRALSAAVGDGTWLSIKGIGWAHGPPWVVLSPKDANLCFGLLDGQSARREVEVSRWLRDRNCDVTHCLNAISLSEGDLALIGVRELPRFRDGRKIDPAVLLTQCRSALRVSDWTPRRLLQWQAELEQFFGAEASTSDRKAQVDAFARHLAGTIRRYHALGAVNDTLAADNVTIAGEITDFEWFFVPEIPLLDGSTDAGLSGRQAKEAIYLIDVLLSLCEGLSLDVPIAELAASALGPSVAKGRLLPFDRQLAALC